MLSVDPGEPRPLLAGLADADPVADRAAVADHVVEPALAGAHDDLSRAGVAPEGDHLARLDRRKRGETGGSRNGGAEQKSAHAKTPSPVGGRFWLVAPGSPALP